MIIYATQKTLDRYKLNPISKLDTDIYNVILVLYDKEKGSSLYEWGCKIFYFDKRKCLQIVHFASKLTIFLVDLKVRELQFLGDAIAQYLFDIYKDDKVTCSAIEKYLESSPFFTFDKITDKSIISTLNKTQMDWALDGYRFYDYIKNGVLHTKQINKDINENWLFSRKVNGKKEYFYSKDLFKKIILENFNK